MAETHESPDKPVYKPLQIPPPQPKGLHRAANIIALIVGVLVVSCPFAGFIALMYQRWQNLPHNSIHWSGVFAFVIAYIIITMMLITFFIIKSKRA